MKRPRRRPSVARASVVAAVLACLGASASLFAATGERQRVDDTLKRVEASPSKGLVLEPLTRARAALGRADNLRAGGDERHAKQAESLALTWAEMAEDLSRAAELEARARAARAAASEAGAAADQERALLEEATERAGRLAAEVDALREGVRATPARTAVDAGPKAEAPTRSDAGAPASPRLDGGAR